MEYQWQMISKDIIIKGHLGSLHMSKSYDNCNSFNVICTAKLLRNFKGLSCQYQRKLKVGDSPEGFIFNYKNNLLYGNRLSLPNSKNRIRNNLISTYFISLIKNTIKLIIG
jgi:hypothetical protein